MNDSPGSSGGETEFTRLDASLAPSASKRIDDYLQSFVSFEPTLGLLYGEEPLDGSVKGSWSLVAYGEGTVNELIQMYSGFGSGVCFELDGFKVVIPQLAHIRHLESGVLEFVGNRLQPMTPGES